jgi:hypothetical protein
MPMVSRECRRCGSRITEERRAGRPTLDCSPACVELSKALIRLASALRGVYGSRPFAKDGARGGQPTVKGTRMRIAGALAELDGTGNQGIRDELDILVEANDDHASGARAARGWPHDAA